MIRLATLLTIAICVPDAAVRAQDPAPAAQQPIQQEKLEQLVAPIALYPDALLAQVLMAATYPLEIVEAARWVQKNPTLNGDALERALQDKTWDPSVKSLCGLPSVLDRMNDNLDWTQDLGDAVLSDEAAVMDAVQNMRRKAREAGNLETTEEQKVSEQQDRIIVVESANPQVIYVPTYYPTVVYGGWYYPRYYYPALYAPPPRGYVAFSFGLGVAWGWAMWGGCHWGWGHTHINVNVSHYNTFVSRTEVSARRTELQQRARDGQWQHDPQHRGGVRYRDTTTAQRYGGSGLSDRVSREQARGYAPTTRPAATRPTQPATRPTQPATRPQQPATTRPQPPTGVTRPGSGAAPRPSTQPSGQRSGSFTGSGNARLDRAASQRGSASRGAVPSRGAPGPGGRGR